MGASGPVVAIIEPVGGHGGMNFYDFGLATGLAAAGASVTVYTCDETVPPAEAPFATELPFRGVYGDAPKVVRGLRMGRGAAAAVRSARRHGATIAHVHLFQATPVELGTVLLARAAGLQVVVTAHDIESFYGGGSLGIARRIYRSARLVVVHNEFSRQELVTHAGVPADKVVVIPHGNYVDAIDRGIPKAAARERLGLPPAEPVLLFLGQIKQVKGLDVLLEALPLVLQAEPSVRLVVAGKVWKSDVGPYRELIDRLGIGPRVTLDIRYVPDREVDLYYAAADLAVFPYRRIYQSGAVLMATSYGCPVVVSDLPGMLETITDGVDGYVFRSGDPQHLAARLVEAVRHPDERRRLGEAGHRRALERHDWHEIGRATLAAYESITRR